MTTLRTINLGLRGTMEAGIVLAFGAWGYHLGGTSGMTVLLCIVAPLLGFGFWGLVDFRGARRFSEPLSLVPELFISGLAVWAFVAIGWRIPGCILGSMSVVHHVLVYLLGDRLLK